MTEWLAIKWMDNRNGRVGISRVLELKHTDFAIELAKEYAALSSRFSVWIEHFEIVPRT